MTDLTEHIQIQVETRFLPDRLPDEEPRYAFAYHILITNQSDQPVQLLNRYWLITDANGHKVEVRGEGVVGEQPLIAAGESYQYTSGAILDTPVGTMEGYYQMQDAQGHCFNAPIEVFSLSVPNVIN